MLLQKVKLAIEHTPFFAHRTLSPPLSSITHSCCARITQTAARQKSPCKDGASLTQGDGLAILRRVKGGDILWQTDIHQPSNGPVKMPGGTSGIRRCVRRSV